MADFTNCAIIEPADTPTVQVHWNPSHTYHCGDVLSAPVSGVSVSSVRELVSTTMEAVCALG